MPTECLPRSRPPFVCRIINPALFHKLQEVIFIMQAKDELEVPSDNSIGYYSANGQLSRGSSVHNLSSTSMFVPDPASMLMQKRIDDLSRGFKQLDRITDEIDYDIETFEGMKLRL